MAKESTMATYENQIQELEIIIQKMESNEIGLDEAMKEYEKGIKLIKQCQKILAQAELRIEKLSQTDDGEEILTPFKEEI